MTGIQASVSGRAEVYAEEYNKIIIGGDHNIKKSNFKGNTAPFDDEVDKRSLSLSIVHKSWIFVKSRACSPQHFWCKILILPLNFGENRFFRVKFHQQNCAKSNRKNTILSKLLSIQIKETTKNNGYTAGERKRIKPKSQLIKEPKTSEDK